MKNLIALTLLISLLYGCFATTDKRIIEKAKKEVLILENKRLLEIGKLAHKHGLHDYEDTLLDQHFSKLSKELSHGNSTEN